MTHTAGQWEARQTNTNENAGGTAGWSISDSWLRKGSGETAFSTFRTGKALRIDIQGYTNFPAIGFRGVSGLSVFGDVIGHVSFPEDVGTAVLTAYRDGTPTTALSVPWSTADNTAVSPDDYAGGQGTLTFAPGETEQTISVPIVDDATREDPVSGVPESFFVDLEPGDNYNLKHRGAVEVRILDNDGDGPVTGDTQPPLLTRATVNGSTLVLTYDVALDGGSVPAPDDFSVTVAGSTITVNRVSIAGATVTLTLATAVEATQAVALDYTPGANPIQDAAGNGAAPLSGQTVTHSTGGGGGGGGTRGPSQTVPGPHPLSYGRLSEPARPLLLRSGGESHGPGIGGGSHG